MKLLINIIRIKSLNENKDEPIKEANAILNALHDNLMDIAQSIDSRIVTYDVEMTTHQYEKSRLSIDFETEIENCENPDFEILFNIKLKQFFKRQFKTSAIFIHHKIV